LITKINRHESIQTVLIKLCFLAIAIIACRKRYHEAKYLKHQNTFPFVSNYWGTEYMIQVPFEHRFPKIHSSINKVNLDRWKECDGVEYPWGDKVIISDFVKILLKYNSSLQTFFFNIFGISK